MNGTPALLHAGAAVVRRDLRLAMSYRGRFFTQLLGTFFSLTLFYYISRLVRVASFGSPDQYYSFAVVGLIILQVLNSTLISPPVSLRSELLAGTFERVVISPFGPRGTIAAMLVYPFLYALVTGLVMLVFAGIVFGVHLAWATLPLAVPVAVLAMLAFAPFGLMLLAAVLVAKQATAGTTWIVAGISLISGLYFPVSLLPGWIEWLSNVQPFTPAVELLRHLLVGTSLPHPAWLDLVKLAGFAAVLLPIAMWVVGQAVRVSRRRGTIIEY
jgi:ABC-2 type transport system permease protein